QHEDLVYVPALLGAHNHVTRSTGPDLALGVHVSALWLLGSYRNSILAKVMLSSAASVFLTRWGGPQISEEADGYLVPEEHVKLYLSYSTSLAFRLRVGWLRRHFRVSTILYFERPFSPILTRDHREEFSGRSPTVALRYDEPEVAYQATLCLSEAGTPQG
ncbi:hypothetical protein E4T39_04148, partial [Aureobasidium subglaciale]